ncbi:MAG: hypothetical protein ACHQCF_01425 [Solirubrobacterales bacterium]
MSTPWETAAAHEGPAGSSGATVQAGHELTCLGPRQRGPEKGLTGDVGDPAMGCDGVALGVDAEHLGPP